MDVKTRFLRAVDLVQNSPAGSSEQPSNDQKLRFYGLYKQATIGNCNIPKPAFYDVVARMKWDAWNNLKDMTAAEAMEEYVDEVIAFLKRFPDRPQVMEIVKSIEKSRLKVSEDQGEFQDASDSVSNASNGGLASLLKRNRSGSIRQQSNGEDRLSALEARLERLEKSLNRSSKLPWLAVILLIALLIAKKLPMLQQLLRAWFMK